MMMASSSIKRVSIKRQLQQFSVQDKLDAIQRVNEGESKASVARDIGVPESTLRGWCKSEEKLRCSSTELENNEVTGMIGDGTISSTGLCNGSLGDMLGPSAKRARGSSASSVEPPTSTASSTKDPELDEALWYWLRQQQQHVAGLSEQLCHAAAQQQQVKSTQQQQQQQSASAAAVAAAAVAALSSTTSAMVSSAANTDLNPSAGWFWRWYKRYGLAAPEGLGKIKPSDSVLPLMTPSSRVSPPISCSISSTLPTNLSTTSRAPAPAHTPQPAHAHNPLHSSLMSVHALAPAHQLLSSTHHTTLSHHVPQASVATPPEPDDPSDDEDDEPPLSAAEAVEHGEKFLRWLDCCSDPSVTALQILQFRYLLNSVRACAARRAKAGNRDKS